MSFKLQHYNFFRDRIKNVSCSSATVIDIARLFRNEINSIRRMCFLSCLEDLITLLEKRDVLNEDNVDCFSIIAQQLGQQDLVLLINNYGTPSFNLQSAHQVLPPPVADLKQRAYLLICDEIGSKWNELARRLEIGEGVIDNLEQHYKNIPDRVMKILIFAERSCCDERLWKSTLLRALENARRRDLRNRVSHIFDIQMGAFH